MCEDGAPGVEDRLSPQDCSAVAQRDRSGDAGPRFGDDQPGACIMEQRAQRRADIAEPLYRDGHPVEAGAQATSRRFLHRQKHAARRPRSEEHTSELQSLMRISYAVFCLKKKKKTDHNIKTNEKVKTQNNTKITHTSITTYIT